MAHQQRPNLRINTPLSVSTTPAPTRTPPCYEDSLLWHLRRGGLVKVLLHRLVPLLLVLAMMYGVHALLSTERGSYTFTLLLAVGLAITALALQPDKLAAPTAVLAALSGSVSHSIRTKRHKSRAKTGRQSKLARAHWPKCSHSDFVAISPRIPSFCWVSTYPSCRPGGSHW
jgi:hypothetical protein